VKNEYLWVNMLVATMTTQLESSDHSKWNALISSLFEFVNARRQAKAPSVEKDRHGWKATETWHVCLDDLRGECDGDCNRIHLGCYVKNEVMDSFRETLRSRGYLDVDESGKYIIGANGLRICLRGPGHDSRCNRFHPEEWFEFPDVLDMYSRAAMFQP